MVTFFNSFLLEVWHIMTEAAPYVIFGFFAAGLLKAFLSEELITKHLAERSTRSVIKASLLGIPMPLCSCGVIPAALGLRKAGASKPATVSFLVSTPETGIDSISISYALLGPVIAIARPIAAIASAITAGLLVGKTAEQTSLIETTTAACCSSASNNSETANCCNNDEGEKHKSFLNKAVDGIYYAFTDLLDNIILWLIVGLVFAAIIKTFVPPSFLAAWGSGLPAMLLMIIIGIPMYVCATASTPIAAGLIMAGISPGTALVFLMAGPATNISTLGVIGKELGRRALLAYLGGVTIIAITSGLLLDHLISYWKIDIQTQLTTSAHMIPDIFAWTTLTILVVLASRRLLNLRALMMTS